MSPDTIKCPPSGIEWNWVTVRFSYENKPDAQPTVNIRPPYMSIPDPQHNNPEHFAVIEQKVAQHLGPLLARGLIRLDGKIQRMRQTDNLVSLT